MDLSVLGQFTSSETKLWGDFPSQNSRSTHSAPDSDRGFDFARVCVPHETTVEETIKTDKVTDDFEEDLNVNEKSYGRDCDGSVLFQADDIIDPTLAAAAINTVNFVAVDPQHGPRTGAKEQAERCNLDEELFDPVHSACLERISGASVVVSNGSSHEKAAHWNAPKDNISVFSEKDSLDTSLMPKINTAGVTTAILSSTKLNNRGRKRRWLDADDVAERVPRKRVLRSSTVPNLPDGSRCFRGDLINLNDHVEGLRLRISEALETLHEVLTAQSPEDLEDLLSMSHSWKLHYTREHDSRMSQSTLKTLRKNFNKVLQLPHMFSNNTLIEKSCLDLDEAFTQYDSIHLHLISGPRPKSKRAFKLS